MYCRRKMKSEKEIKKVDFEIDRKENEKENEHLLEIDRQINKMIEEIKKEEIFEIDRKEKEYLSEIDRKIQEGVVNASKEKNIYSAICSLSGWIEEVLPETSRALRKLEYDYYRKVHRL